MLCFAYAGLEHIRFHDLRHTFATLALQNGIDVKAVSSMLGHSSAGFTLATYTHATNKVQEQAAAKMGNLLKQALYHRKCRNRVDSKKLFTRCFF